MINAAYDADAKLVGESYAHSQLWTSHRYDAAGMPTTLMYGKQNTTWLRFDQTGTAHGQIASSATPGGLQQYSYDAARRLTKVADTFADQCTTRLYGFDADTNRTRLDTHSPASDGACSTSGTPTTQTHGYDAADRVTDPSHTYDAFGCTTQMPAADVTGGADLQIGYHANDVVASLTQGGQSQTFALDPLGRIRAMSATGGPSPGTTTNHYAGAGDSPSWVTEHDGTWTRNIVGFRGLAAIETSAGTRIQLTNLHGDVVATSDNTSGAIGVDAYFEQTEYGTPRQQNTTSPQRYGWLGAHQRSSEGLAGSILMGARVYNPRTGRFAQADPIKGGSANDYEYAGQDPVNSFDTTGTKCTNAYCSTYRNKWWYTVMRFWMAVRWCWKNGYLKKICKKGKCRYKWIPAKVTSAKRLATEGRGSWGFYYEGESWSTVHYGNDGWFARVSAKGRFCELSPWGCWRNWGLGLHVYVYPGGRSVGRSFT